MKNPFTRALFGAALLLTLAACGGGAGSNFPDDVPTNTHPIVANIVPNTGPVGTPIVITGMGFSIAPPNNAVMIGSASIAATAYQLVANPTSSEIESLTATVPTGAAVGQNSVVVIVDGVASNSNVTFAVTP